MSGGKTLDKLEIDLRDIRSGTRITVWVDVFDNTLSRKWLAELNRLLRNNYHLEKNYCFIGFVESLRDGEFILNQVNQSIAAINAANLGYKIDDHFTLENCLHDGPVGENLPGRRIKHDRFNALHRYFEDLQGFSGHMSEYFNRADAATRWHIRQLNLLCHEFENWALNYRKIIEAPDWMRPSQLMCWLHAPRFQLDTKDYELFGIDTLNRPLGGVYVGVNKAVGKTHWEVFNDEGVGLDELTTSALRPQTEAAGDFDIEWGRDSRDLPSKQKDLADFRAWLVQNQFDPDDPSLTIGHPQVGQVDLINSFHTEDYRKIWTAIANHLDVVAIRTSDASAEYLYHWSDSDFIQRQVSIINKGTHK